MKTAGVPESRTKARRFGVPAWREEHLGAAILASLLLHALVLMLQFGTPELGLPWLGLPGDERSASIPALQAILRGPPLPAASAADNSPAKPIVSTVKPAAVPTDQAEIVPPPRVTPPAEPVVATAVIRETPLQEPPQDAPNPLARVTEEPAPAAVPPPSTAVLSTDNESTWSTSVAQTVRNEDAKQSDTRAAEERAKEEAQERQRVEEQARLEEEKAAQQAALKARAESQERQRAEELARIEEAKKLAERQAAARVREAALERQRLEDLARIKEEQRLAEQAAIAKARDEAVAKDLAASALARERREETDRLSSPAMAAAGTASPAAGKPDDGRAAGAGPSGLAAGSGADLAQRALAQAKGGTAVPLPAPADNSRRRGSLLGWDPRDIQLAFYGEGWRQKVERIGGMNFPHLSRNRTYDALVVTVSINSDGTLAGVHIDKSSGYRELDEAVRRIVEMSAPFAAFPPDLKRSYDVVDITRNWTFQAERPRISGE